MEAYGQEVPERATLPNSDALLFRFNLIMEEANELLNAKTKVEYLDAICDLLYVVYGAAWAAGMNSDLVDKAFAEVHRSNMSKFWTTAEKEAYTGNDIDFSPYFDQWVAKSKDGKVIKSPSYSKAELGQLLERRWLYEEEHEKGWKEVLMSV